MKCQENLIRVQRLQQWLQDGKRIAQEVCKLHADVVRKWWCQISIYDRHKSWGTGNMFP